MGATAVIYRSDEFGAVQNVQELDKTCWEKGCRNSSFRYFTATIEILGIWNKGYLLALLASL